MKGKGALSVVLSLSMVALSACSGGANPQPNQATGDNPSGPSQVEAGKEPVKLRIAWWGGQTRHDKYHKIIENFEKKYPYITVVKEFANSNDYWEKLTTQTAGGNAPDVIHMHWTRVSDFANRGVLLNLNDMVKAGKIDLQYFSPAVVDSGKMNGNIYMVALGNSISGVFYNKTMFNELGVPLPKMDWTWAEFIETSNALKQAMNANDKWATNLNGANNGAVRNFFRQRGKDFFAADGKLGFTKQDLTDWWTMWDDLAKTKAIADPATMVEFAGKQEEESLMAKKRVAMTTGASNQLKIYQRSMKDAELDIVRLPTTPGGQNGEFLEGGYISISSKSKYQEEAALFINYMINSEEAVEIFQLEQGPLGSSKMNEFVKPLLEPAGIKEIEFLATVSPHARPVQADPKSGNEIFKSFSMNYEALTFGKKTLQQAVDDFFAEAEKIMK